MKIKIMPFLSKKGNRLAKGCIEFTEELLEGFQLVGFTICEDKDGKLFVMFPSATVKRGEDTKLYFFLHASHPSKVERLENAILDTYESMVAFNAPRVTTSSERR